MANGNAETEHLLKLELDGRLELGHLVLETVGVRHGGRELAGLGETRAQKTGNLLDEHFRSKEAIVLFGELLDQLLVLVELLEVVDRHELEANGFGLVDVRGIGEDAQLHLGLGDVGQTHGARETLVALGVVVLEADLQLDGLGEFARLLLGRVGEHLLDARAHAGCLDFGHERKLAPAGDLGK